MSQRTSDVKATGPMGPGVGQSKRSGDPSNERDYKDLRAIPSATDDIDPERDVSEEFEEESFEEEFHSRLGKLEKQNFRMKLALVVLMMVVGYMGFEQVVTDSIIVRQTLMESRELKLMDNDGNARPFPTYVLACPGVAAIRQSRQTAYVSWDEVRRHAVHRFVG